VRVGGGDSADWVYWVWWSTIMPSTRAWVPVAPGLRCEGWALVADDGTLVFVRPQPGCTDVTLVIGANDVTNPAARNDPSSPIHGMPILNVDQSKSVIALKRSMNSGFAGIDNPLVFADTTSVLFEDATDSVLLAPAG